MSLAKKSWKKVVALFLAVVMALSFTPSITSLAANVNVGTGNDALKVAPATVYYGAATAVNVSGKLSGETEGAVTFTDSATAPAEIVVISDGTAGTEGVVSGVFTVPADRAKGDYTVTLNQNASDTISGTKTAAYSVVESATQIAGTPAIPGAITFSTATTTYKSNLLTIKRNNSGDNTDAIAQTAIASTGNDKNITLTVHRGSASATALTAGELTNYGLSVEVSDVVALDGEFKVSVTPTTKKTPVGTYYVKAKYDGVEDKYNASEAVTVLTLVINGDGTYANAARIYDEANDKTIFLDTNPATAGFVEVKDNVAYFRLAGGATVDPFKNAYVCEGNKTTFASAGADLVSLGLSVYSGGTQSTSVTGDYNVTYKNAAKTQIATFRYTVLGDNTNRNAYYIDEKSLVADYYISTDETPVAKTSAFGGANLANGPATRLDDPTYFTVDDVKAHKFNPQVYTNTNVAVNNANVSYHYFKFSDKDTIATALTTTYVWTAGADYNKLIKDDGSLVDAVKGKEISKPSDQGKYIVLAVLAKDGDFAPTALMPQVFEIKPVAITVIPAEQYKKYGEVESDIAYTAYLTSSYTKTSAGKKTYSQRYEEIKNTDYDAATSGYYNVKKNAREEGKQEQSALRLLVDANNQTALAEKMTLDTYQVETGNQIVDTDKPLLVRYRRKNTASANTWDNGLDGASKVYYYGENVGTYAIYPNVVVDGVDTTTNTVPNSGADAYTVTGAATLAPVTATIGNYTVTMLNQNNTFEIKKRDLTGKTAIFFTDDNTSDFAANPNKPTMATYSVPYDKTKTYEPGFVLGDTIKAPKLLVTTATGADSDILGDSTKSRVTFADKSVTIGYKNNQLATSNASVVTGNIKVQNQYASDESGPHRIDILGDINYEGTTYLSWTIADSGNEFQYKAFIGEKEDFEDVAPTYASTGYLDSDVVELPYIGKPYQFRVAVNTKFTDAETGADVNLADRSESAYVTYGDCSEVYYTSDGNKLTKHEPVTDVEKYSSSYIELQDAGTYLIGYRIKSSNGSIDEVQRQVQVTITKAEFEYDVQPTIIEVDDPDYVIQKKAKTSNGDKIASYYTDTDKNATEKYKKIDDNQLSLYYTYAASDIESANESAKLNAKLIDAETAEEIIVAAHKKAYENSLNATPDASNANIGATGINNKVNGRYITTDYSTTKAKIFMSQAEATAAAVGDAGLYVMTLDGKDIELPESGRSWEALPQATRDKLIEKDLNALKASTWINNNFTVKINDGILDVRSATLPLAVYVHHTAKRSADGTKWEDFALPAGPAVWDGHNTTDSWKYGTYDVIGNYAEVYVNRTNHSSNANFDAIDWIAPLTENLQSNLTYNVVYANNPAAILYELGTRGTITPEGLEDALISLKKGEYYLKAILPSDDKTNVSQGTSNVVKVKENTLEITDAEGGTISVSETFKGLKDEAGKVIVIPKGGKTPIGESDDTYTLYYYVEGNGNAAYASDLAAYDGFDGGAAGAKWKTADKITFATAGEYTIWVIAAPVAKNEMTTTLGTKSNAKKVKLTVTPQEAGQNDKVADIKMLHTADDAGATINFGVDTGAYKKVYGTYTAHQRYDNDKYILDEGLNFLTKVEDNEVPFATLKSYVETELLYNNGYAVGKQNTGLYWGKDKDGNAALKRYADAEKTAYLPDTAAQAINQALNGYDQFGIYYSGNVVDAEGNIVNATLKQAATNASNSSFQGTQGGEITYNNKAFDALDGGTYNGGNSQASTTAYKLLQNVTLKADLVEDPKEILSYTTTGIGENAKKTPRLYIKNNTLQYTLSKDAKTGEALVKVTVSRANYADIEFFVTIGVDAEPPVVSVFNADIDKTASTKVNGKATTTDKYVNKPLDFTVTVTGAKEDGAFYYWSNKALSEAKVEDPTEITAQMWQPLTSETVSTPAEDGEYVLYVKAVDESGNVTFASSANGFTLDTKAPIISNAADTSIVYSETLDNILLKDGEKANIKISDAAIDTVKASVGTGEATEIKPNATTKNYELEANEDTYTIVATDKAGNVTTAKIDVNLYVDNKSNAITITYNGEDIVLKDFADPADPTKKLFVPSENAGEATYFDGTLDTNSKGELINTIADRGAGEVKDGVLHVTKAGTFAIKMTTAKNKIYGETDTYALLTVNKGTRQVSIKLVEDPAAETKVAKTEFSDSEAANISKYADLIFDVKSDRPADSLVTYTYYKKGSETAEVNTPSTPGEYEVSVAVAEDDLFNATDSLNATADKKASYTIGATNKIKITNDDTKGNVKVTDATGAEITDLNAIAKNTAVVITLTPVEGYKFTGWENVKGVTLQDAKAAVINATVTEDIELTSTYAEGIKITKQPQSVKLFAEETATFTVEAVGNGEDDLTYQWQTKSATEPAFRDIAGATTASYTTAKVAAANNGDQYQVVITSKSSGEVRKSDAATVEVVSNSLEGAKITLEADSVVYNGKAQAPKIVKVEINGVEVGKDDYTVSTDTYIDAKEYTVTITGANDYTGSATAKYTIEPKPVTKDMFTVEDVNYTGKAVEAPVTGKDGEKDLVKDTDFTVTYKNNTEVGTATAVVAGKGNYGGTVDVTFNVLGKSIAKATVSGLSAKAYTGKAITPSVTVKLDGKTLKKNTDYTVKYTNNTKVGTATVTITGKGDYSGTLKKTFKIKKVNFKYRAYVQKKNWMTFQVANVSGTKASNIAGTTDNLRMETIQMRLSGVNGDVKYRAYVQKKGWTQWGSAKDDTSWTGTKGQSLRLEMIQLQASGEVATLYDMYYRAYSEKFGWLGWAKSGEKAGSAGYGYKLEAFQVNFVQKGGAFTLTSPRAKCFYDKTKDGANPK